MKARLASVTAIAWIAFSAVQPLHAGTIPTIEPTSEEQKTAIFERQPNEVFEKLLKHPRVEVDGQKLHPKYQYYLEQRAGDGRESAEQKRAVQAERLRDPAAAAKSRASTDRSWTFRTKQTAPMAKVEDRTVPGPGGPVPVRIYTPKVSGQRGPLPVLVYMHGGGWLFGSVAAADRAVRLIANEAKVIVVSVEYRMAPEHRFPAANEDSEAAFNWTVENAVALGGDPERVAVGGDSMGGLMSIAISLKHLREGGKLPAAQLLYYPAADITDRQYPSYDLFRIGYGLDVPFMDMIVYLALDNANHRNHIYASPMNAANFKGMPPAIIATAGFDPIRDHGKVYAERLVADGVTVQYANYSSLIHGFMQFSGTIDDAEAACVETARQFGEMIRRTYYQPPVR